MYKQLLSNSVHWILNPKILKVCLSREQTGLPDRLPLEPPCLTAPAPACAAFLAGVTAPPLKMPFKPWDKGGVNINGHVHCFSWEKCAQVFQNCLKVRLCLFNCRGLTWPKNPPFRNHGGRPMQQADCVPPRSSCPPGSSEWDLIWK